MGPFTRYPPLIVVILRRHIVSSCFRLMTCDKTPLDRSIALSGFHVHRSGLCLMGQDQATHWTSSSPRARPQLHEASKRLDIVCVWGTSKSVQLPGPQPWRTRHSRYVPTIDAEVLISGLALLGCPVIYYIKRSPGELVAYLSGGFKLGLLVSLHGVLRSSDLVSNVSHTYARFENVVTLIAN